jgi:hypothetical protein
VTVGVTVGKILDDVEQAVGAPFVAAPDRTRAARALLFGVHRRSVRVRDGVNLIASAFDVEPDAESGQEPHMLVDLVN